MGEVNKVTINGDEVELRDQLLGVKYWAQHYGHGAPQYEIYTYVGFCEKNQMHFFKGRKNGKVMLRAFGALNLYGFKPFLLDFDKIEKAYQEMP